MPEKLSRDDVRRFFVYDLTREPTVDWATFLYIASVVVGVAAAFYLWPILGAAVGIGLCIGVWFLAEADKSRQRERSRLEFARLARVTREIQGGDATRAFLRIFERSQLDRQDLRALDNRYILEKEKQLFQEGSLAEVLGDLINKSIRLWSRADFNNKFIRKVRWEDGREETFFNPMRIIALFLSQSELVVCDAEIDSVDGDLREKIFRIMLTDIVSIGFTSERVRFPVDQAAIEKMARDMGYEIEETRRMVEALRRADGERAAGYVYEEMTSKLEVTRTDGGTLHFPIKSEILFGKHVSALDQELSLTDDEVAVDGMVNELNRVVRASRVGQR